MKPTAYFASFGWPRARFMLRRSLCLVFFLVSLPQVRAWEQDFHYYVVYLLLRSKGYSIDESGKLAGFSQYIDDNPYTEPLFQASEVRAKFHFDGSKEDQPTPKKGVNGEQRIADAFAKYAANPATGMFHVGAALHLEADSFSHAGFTAWWNSDINRRAGKWWVPKIGHADTEDGGHWPDRPHRDADNALAAAKWLYGCIPPGKGPQYAWSELNDPLYAAFKAMPPAKKESAEFRIPLIRDIIKAVCKDTAVIDYDVAKFEAQSDAFEKELNLP